MPGENYFAKFFSLISDSSFLTAVVSYHAAAVAEPSAEDTVTEPSAFSLEEDAI